MLKSEHMGSHDHQDMHPRLEARGAEAVVVEHRVPRAQWTQPSLLLSDSAMCFSLIETPLGTEQQWLQVSLASACRGGLCLSNWFDWLIACTQRGVPWRFQRRSPSFYRTCTQCNFRWDYFYLSTPCLESTGCGLDCHGVLASDRINIYLSGLPCCVNIDGAALSVRVEMQKPASKAERSCCSIPNPLSDKFSWTAVTFNEIGITQTVFLAGIHHIHSNQGCSIAIKMNHWGNLLPCVHCEISGD